jgi:hypothetical protein
MCFHYGSETEPYELGRQPFQGSCELEVVIQKSALFSFDDFVKGVSFQEEVIKVSLEIN